MKIIKKLPRCFGRKIVECEISSFEELIAAAEKFSYDDWVFRGHADAMWHLVSSVERGQYRSTKMTFENEKMAINQFIELTKGMLDYGTSRIDYLAAMQHYAVPTRLLDFTRSFFVALFFAFGLRKEEMNSSCHAVWALNLQTMVDNADSLRKCLDDEVLEMMGSVKGLSDKETYEVGESYKDYLQDEKMHDSSKRIAVTRRIANKILQGEFPDIGRGILPIELPRNNPRLIAQDGLFMMPTSFSGFEDNIFGALGCEAKESLICVSLQELDVAISHGDLAGIKLLIPHKLRRMIIRFLESVNINPRTVYGDVAGVSQYVDYRSDVNQKTTVYK